MSKKSKQSTKKDVVELAVLITIVVGAVIGVNLALQAAMGTPIPIVVVDSGSMMPTLNVGDVCVIQHVPTDQYVVGNHANRTGDIIVFDATGIYSETEPVIHRIVDRRYDPITNHTWFLTWGDHNPFPDNGSPYVHGSFPNGWVEDTKIYGKVISIIPWIGNIFLFLRGGGVWLVVLVLMVVILVMIVHPVSNMEKKFKEKVDSDSTKKELYGD